MAHLLSRGISTIFAYGLGIALLGVSSIIAIPAMISSTNLDTWGAIATGQAVGAVVAVVGTWGWGMAGPTVIAQSSLAARRTEYVESLRARLVLVPLLVAGGVGLTAFTSGSSFPLAALGCLSTGLIGLTANWYFIGEGRPWILFGLETAPRAATTFLAAFAMISGTSAAVGLLIMCAGVVGASAISSIYIMRSTADGISSQPHKRSIRVILLDQLPGVLTNLTVTVYTSLPIIILSLLAPQYLGHFAILDKSQRQLSTAFSPLLNVLQGWVPRAPAGELLRRIRAAILLTTGFAVIFTFGFSLAGEPFLAWLANHTTSFGFTEIFLTGVVVALNMLELVLARACMIPLGEIKRVATVTVVGSVLGLVAVAALTPSLGTLGALLGVAFGLSVRSAYQLHRIGKGMPPQGQGGKMLGKTQAAT